MGNTYRTSLVGIGIALLTSLWWMNDMHSFFGNSTPHNIFMCLLNGGTNACEALWLFGMHQTNIFASFIFYGGVVLAVSGFFWPSGTKNSNDVIAQNIHSNEVTTHTEPNSKFIMKVLLFIIGIVVLIVGLEYLDKHYAANSTHIRPRQYSSTTKITYQDRIKQAGIDSREAIAACRSQRLKQELKSYAESAKCSNLQIYSIYKNAGYPYMDLIALIMAKRTEVAENQDAKLITESQANSEMGEYMLLIADIERQRDLQIRKQNQK